jgi:hypothetical protein
MSETTEAVVEVAFRQHADGRLSREELISLLAQAINATALENGYAERYGLPCPGDQRMATFTFHVTAERRLGDGSIAVEDFGAVEAPGVSKAIAYAKARNAPRVAILGRLRWHAVPVSEGAGGTQR